MTKVDPTSDAPQQNAHATWCQLAAEPLGRHHACLGLNRTLEVVHPLTGEVQDVTTGLVREPDGTTHLTIDDPVDMSPADARSVAAWLTHMADVAEGLCD